jgi:4-hydroxybenzoate polyprenyltransferase
MKIKQVAKFIGNEFIFGGHVFAVGAVSVVLMGAILLNIPVSFDFVVIVYLIFYSIYLYDHFEGVDNDISTNYERVIYLKSRKKVSSVIIISILIIAVMLYYFSDFYNMIFAFTILVFGLLYGSYFKQITRKVLAFKNFFVSLVWSLLIVFLVFYYSYTFTFASFFIIIFIFLRMLGIQIFLDIRDIDGDRKKGLLTVPVVLGRSKAISILKIINISTVLLIAFTLFYYTVPGFLVMLLAVVFYGFYYIRKVEETKNGVMYYFFAVLEPIFWLLSILLGKLLL